MVHVAYRLWGGDGFFAKMLGTSMLSMFENTKEKITVHIMHNDRLTPDNRGKFCYIAGQYNQQVEFHNVEEIAGKTLRKFESAYPIDSKINVAWYPLIVHEVFPNLDKLICIGADTIFYSIDISELWNIELNENFPFGAVAEFTKWGEAEGAKLCYDGLVRHEDYFNADVFLLAPNFFKENFELILAGCKLMYQKGYILAEQDVLNYLFSKKYQKLPGKFNLVIAWERKKGKQQLRLEKAIYHYAGGDVAKPSFDTDDIYNRLYWDYFLKTPWATADMFGNINKAMKKMFGQILNDSRNTLLQVTNLLAERRRAFLIDEDFVEVAKQIFTIKPNEIIMDFSMESNIFFQKLNALKGEILLFILTNNYWQVRSFLLSKNFIEGTDFVNGVLFLSGQHGFKVTFYTDSIAKEI